MIYWPLEVGTAMAFGSMIIANNGYNVDSKNKNIHIRELELNIEDSDYVGLFLLHCLLVLSSMFLTQKCQIHFNNSC